MHELFDPSGEERIRSRSRGRAEGPDLRGTRTGDTGRMTTRASRTTTKPPKIDGRRPVELDDGDAGDLAAHTTVERMRYSDVDLSGLDLAGVTLSECELTGVSVDGTDFTSARMVDTRIERMHAPKFSASRSTLHNVRIVGSRIGALDLYDSGLRSVVVTDSKISLINLRAGNLRDVLFRGCIIDELDLAEANLTRVAFEDSRIGDLDVNRATLAHVDFRGAEIGVIRNLDGLRGSTISGHQAVALAGMFAAHLGIRIDS